MVCVNWCVGVYWGMMNWSGLMHDCVESVVVIGGVVDSSDRTIRFDQGVLSLYNIAVACFMLTFNISCVWVLNAIIEAVLIL